MDERNAHAAVRLCDRISPNQVREMFSLHARYFENTRLEAFLADFEKKHWCILITDRRDAIVGYSTIEVMPLTISARPVVILFSGDTLVDTDFRGTNMLLPAFVQFTQFLAREYPAYRRYWLLITKGYRTYRLLPVHFKEFHPTFRRATPSDIKRILDAICKEKFGNRYDPATGIVRSRREHDFLKAEHAAIPEGRDRNPDVRFFCEANPGYRDGDELACLTDIDAGNYIPACYSRYMAHRIPIEE
jgi:hypothetical protein